LIIIIIIKIYILHYYSQLHVSVPSFGAIFRLKVAQKLIH